MKVLGQTGLNFIANKFKELKTLVDKKADKSEILSQNDQGRVKILKSNYSVVNLNDVERGFKSLSDYLKSYPNGSIPALFDFVKDMNAGKLSAPSDCGYPYSYCFQKTMFTDRKYDFIRFKELDLSDIPVDMFAKLSYSRSKQVVWFSSPYNLLVSTGYPQSIIDDAGNVFVKQENGKVLSSNDYTNDDKAKVQNIPTVVDNLTTTDATKALSASQGKILNDSLTGKADKSDISRCKTKGYSSASSWSSVSSSRDLEDWIGDFDKRTRELKDAGGVELKTINGGNSHGENFLLWEMCKIGNIVIVSYVGDRDAREMKDSWNLPSSFYPKHDINVSLVGTDPKDGLCSRIRFTIKSNGSLDIPSFTSTVPFTGSFTIMYECS